MLAINASFSFFFDHEQKVHRIGAFFSFLFLFSSLLVLGIAGMALVKMIKTSSLPSQRSLANPSVRV